MKFRWEKKGQLFDPTGRSSWMDKYAQNPNVLELDDRLRIYFTCRPPRDNNGSCVSYTGYADFEKTEPFEFIAVSQDPVLELGGAGDFDQFGIMPGSLVRIPETGEVRLYYVGWTRMFSVPYKWQIGMAVSNNNGRTFERYSTGPILAPELDDPYLQACPRVVRLSKDHWIMHYQSGTKWNHVGDHHESVYITRTAKSKDGIKWLRTDRQTVESIVPEECQTSATWLELANEYHMFFSYRHGIDFRNQEKGYRIGHAHSTDLETWTRDDATTGIDVSESGWDSEMICYPHLVSLHNNIYLFYCGNNFGEFGFGYAKLIL